MNWPTEEPKTPRLNAREAVKTYGDAWRLVSGYNYEDLWTPAVRDINTMSICHVHVRSRCDIAMKHNLLAWR